MPATEYSDVGSPKIGKMSRRWLWMVPKKFRPISIAIIFTKRCHIVIVAMTIHPLQVKFSCDILKHF